MLKIGRSLLFFLFCSVEHTACGEDVLPPRSPDGSEDAMVSEIVSESRHLVHIHSIEWHIGYLMESDEVDTAVQSIEQPNERLGVGECVVESFEDDVLKGESSLVAEVVFSQDLHDLFDAHLFLRRHE